MIGHANGRVGHVLGTHDELSVTLATASASCVPFGGFSSTVAGTLDVLDTAPSGCCQLGAIFTRARFPIAAGATATFYMNAKMDLGGAADDRIDNASLSCEIKP